MTDSELATAYSAAHATAAAARSHWETANVDADRADAQHVMRQANSLAIVLEKWIAARAMRAALKTKS